MFTLEWNDKFSISVDEVDAQHKHLFSLVDQLYRAVKKKTPVEQYLDELVDYTRYHFQEEEKLMESVDYPHLKSHREVHEQLTRQVVEFREQFKGNNNQHPGEFLDFLNNWLVKHVMDLDKKIGRHIAYRS